MDIQIFKFGGASVNSAAGVKNVASILDRFKVKDTLVVISAMGKTTNMLEILLNQYLTMDSIEMIETFQKIRSFHFDIISDLFPEYNEDEFPGVVSLFEQLRGYLRRGHTVEGAMKGYNFEYDQIVSYGELISCELLGAYLQKNGISCDIINATDVIKTDYSYRNARIDWESTSKLINQNVSRIVEKNESSGSIIVTQGFIASDYNGNTTTLGREGSDYTAAVFAYSLSVLEMTIWKDVPGVMNADPKWYPNPAKLETISYREAIELAYFGASVIHPKTIKPLENGNIKLYVRSFLEPNIEGTLICNIETADIPSPIFIRKQNQFLISVSPRDFSFIIEENLSDIFSILARHNIRVNVMQNSAISFSICVDDDPCLESKCIPALQEGYHVKYNKNLELYTIRHYNSAAISEIQNDRQILLEQRTRNTIHLILEA